ncbi:AAA family ATPase [Sulfitobacter sp. D35]|uniref:AAA family ATPase n=1 Tax=Sulfitobacter sp. D35 TaxID=3083252 RepID=UPI00296FBF09|nr:AAA family ATPase [Sulfitobacter sp. D35]MDW4497594.1 AAA family ATPase [Sulfitobacter sp. D35]
MKDLGHHVILSGCSGGGKSTLLAVLAYRGFATVAEPGRRIVAEESRSGGSALPWVDPGAFARRAVDMAIADRDAARDLDGWVFFDRGLVDAAVALEHACGTPAEDTVRGHPQFHRTVFLAPPWPEIYRRDDERRHGLEEGIAEYHRLQAAYRRLGYDPVLLPKTEPQRRADFVLECLTGPPP